MTPHGHLETALERSIADSDKVRLSLLFEARNLVSQHAESIRREREK
jgi:hypothetical protein